jgi:hypothetical protein
MNGGLTGYTIARGLTLTCLAEAVNEAIDLAARNYDYYDCYHYKALGVPFFVDQSWSDSKEIGGGLYGCWYQVLCWDAPPRITVTEEKG